MRKSAQIALVTGVTLLACLLGARMGHLWPSGPIQKSELSTEPTDTGAEPAANQVVPELAPAYVWEKVTVPWYEQKTREAWRFLSSVDGTLRLQLEGVATGCPALEGREVEGWSTPDSGGWHTFVPLGEARLQEDWSGISIPAGVPLWAMARGDLEVPDTPPDWQFVPAAGD